MWVNQGAKTKTSMLLAVAAVALALEKREMFVVFLFPHSLSYSFALYPVTPLRVVKTIYPTQSRNSQMEILGGI